MRLSTAGSSQFMANRIADQQNQATSVMKYDDHGGRGRRMGKEGIDPRMIGFCALIPLILLGRPILSDHSLPPPLPSHPSTDEARFLQLHILLGTRRFTQS